MKELVVPVPETVSATYLVPVSAPMSTLEARQQASKAVEARLTGPLRTLTAGWLAKGVVRVGVEAAGPPPPGLLNKPLFGTPEQRVFLARARAFVRFSATQRASLIAMQEWKARGPAAALAVGLGAPVLDPQTRCSASRSRAGTTSQNSALSWMPWARRRRPCRKLGPVPARRPAAGRAAHGPVRRIRRRTPVGQGRILAGRRTRGHPRHRPGTHTRGAAGPPGDHRDQANR
jgi:hypothetical protein